MQVSVQSAGAVATEIQEHPEGRVSLVLRGRLDVRSTGVLWRELEKRLAPLRIRSLEVDATHLDLQGGIGIALLRYLSEGGMTPGAQVVVRGLNDGARKLLETFTAEDFRAYRPHRPPKVSLPEEVGRVTRALLQDVREQTTFIGAVAAALPDVLLHPKRLRWGEIKRLMETAGANALPVIGLFSWLVGLILALESARPLEQLGAQIFIADLIGFSAIRDTGPLVTAVLLAGRSASAFAAELGTMKVNEELDALKTMGLEPVRFLVVQRVIASVLLTPLLALYAMVLGIIGGVMVMRFMGFPPLMIYHQLIGRVGLGDIVVGINKSLIFGVIVGSVGCLRGLQTKHGAQAVGHSTTRAVVASMVLIILADTLYSTANYFLASRA